MKIDFHTHGKLAKKLPFSGAYTSWLLTEAKTAGLDSGKYMTIWRLIMRKKETVM